MEKTKQLFHQEVEFINTDLPDILEFKHIGQSYDGGHTWIIKDLNLLIENKPGQGQFVVILGTSGCGKSTLLRYVCGLQDPTEGTVLVNAQPLVKGLPISMVFQQYSSFPWHTVIHNVMLPLLYRGVSKKEARARAMDMLGKVGLIGHEWKYAKSPILSGGQLQRVAIARSLISNPKILLMDEPFGALDINTRHDMQVRLAELWEQLESTIIFVTHDINEAVFLADDIWVMGSNPGRIVKTFHINLPPHRDRATKKEPEFIRMAQEVEDFLINLRAADKKPR